jgi:hypothetical protein
MTTSRLLQQRFTQGELDPKMLGRSDIEQYYGAMEIAQDIVTMPQGGFKRRGGLEHIDKNLRVLTLAVPTVTAPNGGTTGNATDQNPATSLTTTTNISTTNPYVVVQYDITTLQAMGVVYIYGLALTAGTSSEFYLQASTDASAWATLGGALSVTTTAKNFTRRIGNSYRYVRLVRIGATDLGTAKATLTGMDLYLSGALSSARHITFEFSSDQAYQLVATDKNLAVYLDGVLQIDLYLAEITSARLLDITYTQSADTLIIFHEDFPTYIIQRAGADDAWTTGLLAFANIPAYAFTEVIQTGAVAGFGNITPSAATGTIKITAVSGTFNSTHINQYIEGNGGRAKVLSIVSGLIVNAFVEIPFYNTDAILAANWELLTGYEPTWSVSRGWPICGTFHEGALWIGGSKSRPTTTWRSRVGIYYDFDQGTGLDDEGMSVTLDNDQLNRITNMYSGRDLMVFTTGTEFIFPQSLNEPITPSNVSVARQSRIGSTRGLGVFEVEGGVFYCQNGGQSVQEFIFNDSQQAYGNNILSLLSGHIVKNPVDFNLRRATSLDDGALLVMVRSNGEATIATIQRSQSIGSFCRQTTDGLFKACGVDYNDIYFTVERTISGVTERYLERYNEEYLLDASTKFTTGLPATTFYGLEHLDGKECRVVADGSIMENRTVVGGSITVERAVTTSLEVGLWFQPIMKDLPSSAAPTNSSNGGASIMGKLISISEIIVRLYQTSACKINNKSLYFRRFGPIGISPLDAAPPQFTGVKRLHGWRGYTDTGQVTITQDVPAPLTVLALSKRITFEG